MSDSRRPLPRGWHSRGYLPHFDAAGLVQHVVFRLADSLPPTAIGQLRAALPFRRAGLPGHERRRRLDQLLDAGLGSCVLAQPETGRLVEDALLHFDGDRYRLLAWVVMPNHVHAVVVVGARPLAHTVASWKSYTGRRLADARGAADTRQVWHREYWDRYVRDADHLDTVVRYVEWNPVRAGLVRRPEDWPWTSARRRR